MGTEAELAEHGIVGSADALPVPPGPEPQGERLSIDRIAEIQQRVNAATPGPWEEHAAYGENFYAYLGGPYLRGVGTLNFGDGDDAEADKALTVNAREDIRALLAELFTVRAELRVARGRVAELEDAAQKIVHLHKDSPMGPCPVCIDGDAMVRGDDYTLPYPCPTARLAGAKDCDPPSYRTADFFQPGHAYTHRPGPDSPGGPRLRFYCESVTTDKATGQPVARGWGGRRYGDRWTSVQQARGLGDWQSGAWVDTTAGGDAR